MSQQVSNQRVSQTLYFGAAAVAGGSPSVTTGPPSTESGGVEELLAPVRDQPAYVDSGLPHAWALTSDEQQRQVRVALVGDAVDPAVLELAGIASRVEAPYVTQHASERGYGVGAASLGHILAIASRARVTPVSVLSAEGAGSGADLLEGLVAAFATRPDILLLGVGFPAAQPGSPPQPTNDSIEELLGRRAGKEVLVVAPAGNNAQPTAGWPAALDGVVSVGAIDADGQRASFSNFGVGVDVAAPGVGVTCLAGADSGRPTFRALSGTTFSADIVAGVAALVMSVADLGPSEVGDLLLRASTRRTPEGTPILDAGAAVELALADR